MLKIVSLFLCLNESWGHTRNRNSFGTPLKWFNSNITLFVNGDNENSISAPEVLSVLKLSTDSWGQHSKISFKIIDNQSFSPQSNRNDVYFTKKNYFGSGVLAITQVSYEGDTGKIESADILINDNEVFNVDSTNASLGTYIGDVLSHEIGHLLGLSHSEVFRSTMNFEHHNGQRSVHADDLLGVSQSYSTDGITLFGQIIGKNGEGILGAHVQLIQAETGKVVGGVLSERSGKFTLKDFPKGTYYIFVGPVDNESDLPFYFKGTRKKYCHGYSYQGTFFRSCNNQLKGYVEGVSINSDTDLGQITIRCGAEVPLEYVQNKGHSFTLKSGEAMMGFFTGLELSNASTDIFSVDLSGVALTGGEYLQVNIVGQSLYFPTRLKLNIASNYQNEDFPNSAGSFVTDSDSQIHFDINARVALSSTSANNVFTLTLTPLVSSVSSLKSASYFPSHSTFLKNFPYYLISVDLVRKNGETYSLVRTEKTYRDNQFCPQSLNSFENPPLETATDTVTRTTTERSVVSCKGSGANKSHQGMGIFLVFLIWSYHRWRRKNEGSFTCFVR